MDFSALTPTRSADQIVSKRGRTPGPNPFVENGWLLASYNEEAAYEVPPVPGVIETYVQTGKSAGREMTRVTGEARTIVNMIRDAADRLGIGVRIQTLPAKKKGEVIIKYMGTVRRTRTSDE